MHPIFWRRFEEERPASERNYGISRVKIGRTFGIKPTTHLSAAMTNVFQCLKADRKCRCEYWSHKDFVYCFYNGTFNCRWEPAACPYLL